MASPVPAAAHSRQWRCLAPGDLAQPPQTAPGGSAPFVVAAAPSPPLSPSPLRTADGRRHPAASTGSGALLCLAHVSVLQVRESRPSGRHMSRRPPASGCLSRLHQPPHAPGCLSRLRAHATGSSERTTRMTPSSPTSSRCGLAKAVVSARRMVSFPSCNHVTMLSRSIIQPIRHALRSAPRDCSVRCRLLGLEDDITVVNSLITMYAKNDNLCSSSDVLGALAYGCAVSRSLKNGREVYAQLLSQASALKTVSVFSSDLLVMYMFLWHVYKIVLHIIIHSTSIHHFRPSKQDLVFNLNIKYGFRMPKHPNKNIDIQPQYQYHVALALKPMQCQASQCLHPNKALDLFFHFFH